ncbi:MAG: hypothetical protein D6750_10570, partial [Bacteroidetes bacterium]
MKHMLRNRHFLLLDICVIFSATAVSYIIRLETLNFDAQIRRGIILYACFAAFVHVVIFYISGMYSRYWASAGQAELLAISSACFLSALLITLGVFFLTLAHPAAANYIPRSVPLIEGAITTLAVIAVRFSSRLYRSRKRRTSTSCTHEKTLIVGAGQTGIQVLEVLQQKGENVVGFLDDDPRKIGTLVRGIRVLGCISELSNHVNAQQVKRVIIAIPSAPGKVIRRIAEQSRQSGIEPQILPSIYELALGKFSVSRLRPIQIDDLLRRTPVR